MSARKETLEFQEKVWKAVRNKKVPLFGTFWVQRIFEVDKTWSKPEGYIYRRVLRALHSLKDSGKLYLYTTGQNEHIWIIAERLLPPKNDNSVDTDA